MQDKEIEQDTKMEEVTVLTLSQNLSQYFEA